MWPMLLDYDRDQSKKFLRQLELEAYSSIVSALRAQGELNKDKKKILHELSNILSITLERHQAEIRRAVNDEKLNTIAYNISGHDTHRDWAIEGRRLVPLLPRLVPQTAITSIANVASNIQIAKNEALPQPEMTSAKAPPKEISKKRKHVEPIVNHPQSMEPTPQKTKISSQHVFSVAPTVTTAKAVTSNIGYLKQVASTSSTTPRVVFMTSYAPGLTSVGTMASSQAGHLSSTSKAPHRILCTPEDIVASASGQTGKISQKGSIPQQVVVFPANTQQKSITIPVSQSLKSLQLPQGVSSSSTFVYQQNNATPTNIKGIPGTFTIQTFKPSPTAKFQGPNLIIMPANKSNLPTPKTLPIGVTNCTSQKVSPIGIATMGAGTKCFTRPLQSKEMKVLSSDILGLKKTSEEDKEGCSKDVDSKVSQATFLSREKPKQKYPLITLTGNGSESKTNNYIEIQASGPVLQNIMKTGQLNKDIMELVQRAVTKVSVHKEPTTEVQRNIEVQEGDPTKNIKSNQSTQ